MNKSTLNQLAATIRVCSEKGANAPDGTDALKFTQAALNAANAYNIVKQLQVEE